MNQSNLIIVSGLPCTGKTTLSEMLSKKLGMPVFSKDQFKESLFDSLGIKDREWSKTLGVTSYQLLYSVLESFLRVGDSLILESNFNMKYDTSHFLSLKENYSFNSFQIICQTEGRILYNRFKKRSLSGKRHPGHVDHLNLEEFKPVLLSGKYDPIEIGGQIIKINTDNFDHLDQKVQEIIKQLNF